MISKATIKQSLSEVINEALDCTFKDKPEPIKPDKRKDVERRALTNRGDYNKGSGR